MCYHLPFPESNNRIKIAPKELTKFCSHLRPSLTLGFTRYRILANAAAITDDGFKVGLEAKGCTYNVSNVDRAVVVVHPNHDKSRTEPTITHRSGFIMQRLAFAIRYAALRGSGLRRTESANPAVVIRDQMLSLGNDDTHASSFSPPCAPSLSCLPARVSPIPPLTTAVQCSWNRFERRLFPSQYFHR